MAKAVSTIHRNNGYSTNAYTYYPVLVIGAGESGIAMGCRLRQVLGFDQFRILERKSGIGGTWYTNRYPGIACDVPAIVYSYSFAPNPHWTGLHPSGPEIVCYLHDVCERFKILDKIQLNTDVTKVQWLEDSQEWQVTLAYMAPGAGDLSTEQRKAKIKSQGLESVYLRREIVRAKIVVSAVGGLVEPKCQPDIPGLDSFNGLVIHPAQWNADIDLTDKNVIVVGTGCSAAQVTPTIIQPPFNAKSVTQILRSPPWVQPPFPSGVVAWWAKWMPWLCTYVPGWQWTVRKTMFSLTELEFVNYFSATEAAREQRKIKAQEWLSYMRQTVPEEYHEILTPDYELFCKRRVVDTNWLKHFHNPKIDLTSLPLTSVQPDGVTLGPGRNYPPMSRTDSKVSTEERKLSADVIVFANGYETNGWLHPLEVVGKNGRSLRDIWDERGGSQAYLGTAMDGFPNFFLIFGPNTVTGHSSVILATENMVNYSLKFIKPIIEGDVATFEVKEEAERRWTADIQRELKNSVSMSGGCKSWYMTENGWNATLYPRTQIDFSIRCMFPRWNDWNAAYTSKGLRKLRLSRILNLTALLSMIWGLLWAMKVGRTRSRERLKEVVRLLREKLAGRLGVLKGLVEVK